MATPDQRKILRLTGIVVCVALGLLVLFVMFADTTTTTKAVTSGSKQVFVFRHCVRAPTDKIKYGHPDFKTFSDYTSKAYPTWEVPANWCTPNGIESIMGEGAAIRQFGGKFDRGLRVYADGLNRDVQTALDLLRGLDRENSVVIAGKLFDSLDPEIANGEGPFCEIDEDTEDQAAETIRARLETMPAPFPYNLSARSLQAKLGLGAAPAIADLPNELDHGKLHGGLYLMKAFSQAIFYSFASGMDYMHNLDISADEMYEYLSWQFHYRALTHWTAKDAIKSAGLVRYVMKELEDDENGVTIFVGHDSDLNSLAMYFDLHWDAPPYCCSQDYPTPPGSGIMFELSEGGTVSSSFVYPIYTSASTPASPQIDGNLTRVHARKDASLSEWKQTALDTLNKHPLAKECWDKFTELDIEDENKVPRGADWEHVQTQEEEEKVEEERRRRGRKQRIHGDRSE